MKITKDFKITTKRLLLVPISLIYRDSIFDEFTEEVAKFLIPKPTNNLEDTVNFINSSLKNTLEGRELQLVALDKISKEFLGCLGLHHIDTKNPELGLWFKRSVWGIGYGKESMSALKQWVKDNLVYDSIIYPAFKDNIPSRKIAEFLGGKITREVIGKNSRGEDFEEVEYSIE